MSSLEVLIVRCDAVVARRNPKSTLHGLNAFCGLFDYNNRFAHLGFGSAAPMLSAMPESRLLWSSMLKKHGLPARPDRESRSQDTEALEEMTEHIRSPI